MEIDHRKDLCFILVERDQPVGDVGAVVHTVTGAQFICVFSVLKFDLTRYNCDKLLTLVLRHLDLTGRLGKDLDEKRFHMPVDLALTQMMKDQGGRYCAFGGKVGSSSFRQPASLS